MNSFLKKYIEWTIVAFVTSIIVIVVTHLFFIKDIWSGGLDGEIHALLYFFTGIATSAIFIGSWVQLQGINKKNKADFLLEIDKRWCSEEITAVRKELWTMYTKNRKGMGTTQDNINDLLEAHKKVDENLKENIDTLFRHLNFIELLGAIHAGGYLDEAELRVVYGGKLPLYLKFYKVYFENASDLKNSNAAELFKTLNPGDQLKDEKP